jgi:hypothetical protein
MCHSPHGPLKLRVGIAEIDRTGPDPHGASFTSGTEEKPIGS